MAVEHSTELDKLGKRFLPEGLALARDRATTAEKVTDDFREWARATNRMDLRGFDTKSARERKPASVIKEIKGIRGRTLTGEDAIIEEPDRFFNKTHATFKLLEKERKTIVDFNSFKSAVKRAWNKDYSLRYLIENLEVQDRDDVWRQLFIQPQVQAWIDSNTFEILVPFVMRRFNIEEGRARKVISKLSTDKRQELWSSLLGIRTGRPLKPAKVTARAKPMRWTPLQTQFISRIKNQKPKEAFELYNSLFREQPRTFKSIKNKLYRIRKTRQKRP